jgi:hypothetical protein
MTDSRLITNEEWFAMHRAWLANCDMWLAQHPDPYPDRFDPNHYTTLSDGRHHPCDDPSLEPKEFFLAVFRDRAIPLDLRVWAAKQIIELYSDHDLRSDEDYLLAQETLDFIRVEGATVQ